MPSDIRSFFGGRPAGIPAKAPPPKEEKPKGRGRTKKNVIVEDSEDDDDVAPPKKATPKKAAPKPKKVESPKETVTSTSDYFGASSKPKRSEPVKAKPAVRSTATPKKTTPAKTSVKSTPNTNGTPIRTKPASQSRVKIERDIDNDDNIFKSNYRTNGKKDDYIESSDEEIDVAPPKKAAAPRSARKSKVIKDEEDFEPEDEDVDMKDTDPEDDFVVPDDDEVVKSKKPSKAVKASTVKKRKSPPDDDDEEEDEPPKKGRKKAATTTKSPAKKKAKKDEPENTTTQAIFDSITQIRAPTPPPRDPNKKFNFAAHAQHQNSMSQSNAQMETPTGAENCLAGLNFVFTGVLANLDRTVGQNLVKRYGGKVQSSASTRTDFVVLGADAGPKKLEVIRDNKLKTIDEVGLFELIQRLPANGGSGKAAAAFQEKQAKEEAKVKKMAEEMEKEEKALAKAVAPVARRDAKASSSKSAPNAKPAPAGPDSRLWTTKYAPNSMSQICGNKGQVEKLQNWLRNFPKNKSKGFKMPGKDGSGIFRAVIIHGPPGIGKTTAAHVVAKEEGYDIVETNASDTRSKRLMEESLRGILNTTSLLGYFAGDGKNVEGSKKKMVLIMDEVDGMTGSDRGGVGALAKVCKTSEIPMILICNDRKLPKMKPFDFVTYDMQFRRPTTDQIRGRMLTIAFRENLNMPTPVLNALIEGSGADIRQVVNMLSTSKLDQEAMDFDKGKAMSKAWEKHIILKPWDIVGKILGSGMWADSSTATLNNKAELYFNDHEFSHLMLQENYLGTFPMKANNYSGKEKNLKVLELVSDAADSISDGDLVDRMIHGSQQQWSLMPMHAIFSFVRPASYVAGAFQGYGSTRFTAWLGQNSKQNKLSRFVKEIQGHMRLRSTGDRHEIRQQYVPALWEALVRKLQLEGKEAVPSIIDLMDSYFLTRDDWDAVLELGVGRMDMEKVKIETQAKSTFTRLYNAASHPMPFMKASAVMAPAKMAKEKPDLEEALEESDDDAGAEPDVAEKAEGEDEEIDLKKDKYIKAPKKKAPPKGAGGAGKGRKKKVVDEDEDMDSEEEKPKKKGKGKAAKK